jgi:hypothetical protein
MTLLSFDEILTVLCDKFDELIAPKKISRSNTNIIYLIFKAISKGFEIINSVCVVLSNKFDPASCSTDDLVSVASLVGTERRKGSASGLRIVARNTGDSSVVLPQGFYTYSLDDDTKFEFEVVADTEIEAGSYASFIAMSEKVGQYPVTAQSEITVDTAQTIPDSIKFDCDNNSALLGLEPETLLAFRKRVLNTYDRQNTFVELEEYLRNLPYVFDCKIKYNQTDTPITVDGIVIPPMTCAIFYSGEAKNEIAEMVADYIICPTVSTQDSIEVHYENSVFVDGYYSVNLIPFAKYEYTVDLIYSIDNVYANPAVVLPEVESKLLSAFNTEEHKDYIKEDDIYNVLETLNIASFEVLAVNLKVNGSAVDYVTVPTSKIPKLASVHFIEG